MNVVVVESPAKAKTINKYLGPGYTVLASFGHVRDLPAKDGSVLPDQDFEMFWEVDTASQKRMKDIADAVKSSDGLFLATDPDREGEAISWHVLDLLKKKKVIGDKPVKRVVFNAITKKAVLDAMADAAPLLAEGADASAMTRSIPMEKALDDCMVAFAQNGEALRPEQGYPLRLVVPGWEGNMWIKWLRRLEIGDAPWQAR